MNKHVRGLIVISVNLIIVIFICALWLQSIKRQRILHAQSSEIRIHGTNGNQQLLEQKDIIVWLQEFYKKDLRKIPVYSLRLKQLEEYILSQPLVKRADIYMDGKNQLHVDVYQRIPLLRIIDISGNQYYLDEEGYKIPTSSKYASRVMVATGKLAPIEGRRLTSKERIFYSGLISVARAIHQDSFALSLVEQIDLDDKGEFTLIPKIGNEKIFLGGSDLIEDKLDRLKIFYKENMGRQGWNVYQLVNLKFKGQVIGKKLQQES